MESAANINLFSSHQGPNTGNNANANVAATCINGMVQPVIRDQDRLMPIANINHIMYGVLPPYAVISDNAKETIQECVSEYVSFITSEANDRCQREQRKTITSEDIIWGMNKLGFDNYVDSLTHFLHMYRKMKGGSQTSMREDPLPLWQTRSGTGLLPLQPTMMQMATQPQLPLHVNMMGGVNAVPQQQQGVDGDAIASCYNFGVYGDGHGVPNSGNFVPYADYK